jgi:uncharacterized tellurite resistance protein B-like protein
MGGFSTTYPEGAVLGTGRSSGRGQQQRITSLMLERLRHFISDFATGESDSHTRFDDNDYRLAATALLIHVVSLEGEPSEAERRKLHSLLQYRFELDAQAANDLIALATQIEGEAVDLYHFTSRIMRSVNEIGRARIVEMMWELVYVDGHASEFEESVVWRAADLMGISSTERIALKHRVAESRKAMPDAAAT